MSSKFDQAEAYDDTASVQREHGHELLQLLAPEKGCKVLDLGCGTGYFSKVLAEMVGPEGKVVAIDPDVERLKLAREKYPASNLEYHEGRAQNIPGTDYDIIFANYILHWCEDKDLVFQQVAKSLKPGGRFAFVSATTFDVQEKLGPAEMFSAEFIKGLHDRVFTVSMDKYLSLASSQSLETVYLAEDYSRVMYEDIFEFVEFWKIHTHGTFDDTHFNIDSLKKHYGENFTEQFPVIQCILKKT